MPQGRRAGRGGRRAAGRGPSLRRVASQPAKTNCGGSGRRWPPKSSSRRQALVKADQDVQVLEKLRDRRLRTPSAGRGTKASQTDRRSRVAGGRRAKAAYCRGATGDDTALLVDRQARRWRHVRQPVDRLARPGPSSGIEAALSPRRDRQHSTRTTGSKLDLRIELGRTRLQADDVRQLRSGSVVLLDGPLGEPAAIYAAERLIGRGEIVVVDGKIGVRVELRIAGTFEVPRPRSRLRLRNETHQRMTETEIHAIGDLDNRADSSVGVSGRSCRPRSAPAAEPTGSVGRSGVAVARS